MLSTEIRDLPVAHQRLLMEIAFVPDRRRHELALALSTRRRKGARGGVDSAIVGELTARGLVAADADGRLRLGDRISRADQDALRSALIDMAVGVRAGLREIIEANALEILGAVGALRSAAGSCLSGLATAEMRDLSATQLPTLQVCRFRLYKAGVRLSEMDALPGAGEIQAEDKRRASLRDAA